MDEMMNFLHLLVKMDVVPFGVACEVYVSMYEYSVGSIGDQQYR